MHAEYGIFVYTIWPLSGAAPHCDLRASRAAAAARGYARTIIVYLLSTDRYRRSEGLLLDLVELRGVALRFVGVGCIRDWVVACDEHAWNGGGGAGLVAGGGRAWPDAAL